MRSTTRLLQFTAVLLALLAPTGCSKPPLPGDLVVGEITTGRILAPDGSITEESRTTSFWTTDTFYVSVQTQGAAQNIALQARWTGPDGKVAAEATKTISPSGTTITALEAPPKDGRWPEGAFKVEILVNGASQGTRELTTR